MDWLKIVPGKTNLNKYENGNWKVHGLPDEEIASSWENMDDTSDWILNTDKQTIVGQLDWSTTKSLSGIPNLPGGEKCSLLDEDIYLDRIDVYDKGKGIGTEVLERKHKQWAKKGYTSVTLFPEWSSFQPSGQRGSQKSLTLWYEGLGYNKSDKCKQKPKCADNFDCFLTKYIGFR